jgi:hypothetical protein
MMGPALLCHQLPPDDDHCQASNTKSKIASLCHMQKEIFVATDLDHSNLFVTTIRMLMLIVTNQASNSYTKSKKRIVLVMPSTV